MQAEPRAALGLHARLTVWHVNVGFTTPHLPDGVALVPEPRLSRTVGSVAARASTMTTVLEAGPDRLFDIRGSSAYFPSFQCVLRKTALSRFASACSICWQTPNINRSTRRISRSVLGSRLMSAPRSVVC